MSWCKTMVKKSPAEPCVWVVESNGNPSTALSRASHYLLVSRTTCSDSHSRTLSKVIREQFPHIPVSFPQESGMISRFSEKKNQLLTWWVLVWPSILTMLALARSSGTINFILSPGTQSHLCSLVSGWPGLDSVQRVLCSSWLSLGPLWWIL